MARSRSRRPVVVIAGASAGVGRATAVRFASAGWDVGLIARGRRGLEGASADVADAGGRAHIVACDVADAAAVDDAAMQFERELGPIDVWVNSAMVTVFGAFDDVTPDEFERVVDVTFLGSVWGTRAALKRMTPRNRGVVVQVEAALGERGLPNQSAYSAAQHALSGFIDSVRTELASADSDVSLRVAQLPAVNTPQFAWARNHLDARPRPLAPVLQPEVAAEAVFHLATHARRETWVGASTAGTVTGDHDSGALVDSYLARTGVRARHASGDGRSAARDNLFDPVDDDLDVGAHGPFDDTARDRSLELALTRHRGLLATLGAGLAAGAAAWWASREAA